MNPKSALALAGALTSASMCFSAPAAAQSAAPPSLVPPTVAAPNGAAQATATPVPSAQPAPTAAPMPAGDAPPPEPGAPRSNEPNVKYTVIEDEGSKIEELKVRGNTQRITVTPKVGVHKSYEILTGDGSRDLTQGANTSRGVVGQRVWNVLKF